MTLPPCLLVWEDVPCAAQAHTTLSSLWEARKTWQNIKKPVEVSAGVLAMVWFPHPVGHLWGKKIGDTSFLRAMESAQLGCRGVLCVGWGMRRGFPVGLGTCSGAAGVLQVSWDPAVAGANLLQFLGVMERKSLFSCADGDILDSVSPGKTPRVAGEESKPGEKILACKGVRKKPTASFDGISSSSSNSAHLRRWLASCYFFSMKT